MFDNYICAGYGEMPGLPKKFTSCYNKYWSIIHEEQIEIITIQVQVIIDMTLLKH